MITLNLDDFLANTPKVAMGSRMEQHYVNFLQLLVKEHEKQTLTSKEKQNI